MKYFFSFILILSFTFISCQTNTIKVTAGIDHKLKEVSAVETIEGSSLFWTIEDAGNASKIYGLDKEGHIIKSIKIEGVKNNDWEDLTHDSKGNIYIGDFGNNSKKRKKFSILKVSSVNTASNTTTASVIDFTLPKKMKSKDFEAFFLLNDRFYIFSKENKKSIVISVPNKIGNHEAKLVSKFKLKGGRNKVTSADISNDGKTVVLLNHNKIWRLTDFEGDHFFTGKIEALKFGHKSQKEGVCFKNNGLLYITDERRKSKGGNIYSFNL